MKEYIVEYEIKTIGQITVSAENEEDAMEEIDLIFCDEDPKYSDNTWIDKDTLWDCEWITETIKAEEQ